MSAGRAAINTELVLEANDVHVADVQKVGGSEIGRQILFFNFEADHVWIFVGAGNIVYRNRKALALRIGSRNRRQQV